MIPTAKNPLIVPLITVFYAILLSAVSLLPSGDDTAFGGWDAEISPTLQNLMHVPAYAVFMLLLLLTFNSPAQPLAAKTSILLATACTLFGLLLEWLQAVAIPGRTGSLEDALLNAAGVVLGAVLFTAALEVLSNPFSISDGKLAQITNSLQAGTIAAKEYPPH